MEAARDQVEGRKRPSGEATKGIGDGHAAMFLRR
jgi:hypothetical protein